MFYATSSHIVMDGFSRLENQLAHENLHSLLEALKKDGMRLSSTTGDYARWDDTCQFVRDGNPGYVASNLTPDTLSGLSVDLAVFVDTSGRIVYSTETDPATENLRPVPGDALDLLAGDPALWRHSSPLSDHEGIILLPEGPMLIASRPVTDSCGQGPLCGSVIFGRRLGPALIGELESLTHSTITLHGLHDSDLPADFRWASGHVSNGEPVCVKALN